LHEDVERLGGRSTQAAVGKAVVRDVGTHVEGHLQGSLDDAPRLSLKGETQREK
jgi:hypothetical protein